MSATLICERQKKPTVLIESTRFEHSFLSSRGSHRFCLPGVCVCLFVWGCTVGPLAKYLILMVATNDPHLLQSCLGYRALSWFRKEHVSYPFLIEHNIEWEGNAAGEDNKSRCKICNFKQRALNPSLCFASTPIWSFAQSQLGLDWHANWFRMLLELT